MRTILSIVIAALPLLAAFGTIHVFGASVPEPERKNTYSDCGVIMDDPGKIGDDVIVTFQNGHMFAFENQDGDWFTGDLVTITFNDMGTDEITDDEIIDYRYSGWISETEMEIWIK